MSVHEDVADLAALTEHVDMAPAHLVGNSFGASISLRLATGRPDLIRPLVTHEPPLSEIVADDPSTVWITEASDLLADRVANCRHHADWLSPPVHRGRARSSRHHPEDFVKVVTSFIT